MTEYDFTLALFMTYTKLIPIMKNINIKKGTIIIYVCLF